MSLDGFLFSLVVKDGIALELDIFLFSLSQLDLGLFIPTKNEKENFLDQCDELAKQGSHKPNKRKLVLGKLLTCGDIVTKWERVGAFVIDTTIVHNSCVSLWTSNS